MSQTSATMPWEPIVREPLFSLVLRACGRGHAAVVIVLRYGQIETLLPFAQLLLQLREATPKKLQGTRQDNKNEVKSSEPSYVKRCGRTLFV
jgi:hypothetical protein